MKELKINHLAVWLIVVLAQVIPMGWYSLFADPWMKYNDLTMDFVQENESTTPYIASIIGSIIMAYTLAWLFKKMNIIKIRDKYSF